MSAPDEQGFTPVPARTRRLEPEEAPPPAAPAFDADDLARGQAAAVLGVLGRLQLRIDLLAREQAEALARIEARLASLEARSAPSADGAAGGGSTHDRSGE